MKSQKLEETPLEPLPIQKRSEADKERTDKSVAQSAGMDWQGEDEAEEMELSRTRDEEFEENLSTDLPEEEEGPARTRVDTRH